ncbi:MAG: hypothetical protein JNL05_10130 [Flavobacteriales bacterium]|nr:hypothetical protein [Flavobacteriales bacterium]
MTEVLKAVGVILGVVLPVGGFLFWHFKTVNAFKDEIHKMDIRLTKLEETDRLQQDTIDQLNKLFPTLVDALRSITEKKKR